MLDPAHLSPRLSDDDHSGASTPPLWPTSPPAAHHYRTLSPASRTQAIMRGRMELMEMVRNMPDSCYELSLKDLVELPPPPPRQQHRSEHDEEEKRPREAYGRKGYGNKVMARSGSNGQGQQEGLLLKMVFPVYTGGFKGRRNKGNKKQRKGKVDDDSAAATEKEWWRKRSGNSESGDSSSTAGGSGKSSGSSGGSSSSNSANSDAITTVRYLHTRPL